MGDNYRFDLKAFIRDLGGNTKVAKALAELGISVQPTTVKKWLERDSVDLVYVVNLFAHRALSGLPLDFQGYITRDRRPGGARIPRRPRRPLPGGE